MFTLIITRCHTYHQNSVKNHANITCNVLKNNVMPDSYGHAALMCSHTNNMVSGLVKSKMAARENDRLVHDVYKGKSCFVDLLWNNI